MKFNILKSVYILAISILLFSCQKDSKIVPNPMDGYVKLQDGYAIGASAKVEIWGRKNFFVGYNNLIVAVYDSLNLQEKITNAHIYFMPLMTMGSGAMVMQHASPIENPGVTALNNVFPGAVVFTMPTTVDGSWKLGVIVHNHKYETEGEAQFEIVVDNPEVPVLSVFTAITPDASRLVLSLLEPSSPKVGMNDIEFTIHRKASAMEFPADDSYTIEITPEMPSMGHGSPNNVNPVNIGNGHYKGQVNFTMTGEWRVNVLVKKDGVAVSNNAYFTISL